jgi:hypothetical protein
LQRKNMMAANHQHIGGGENRLGRHHSQFSGIWPTSFLAAQSLTLRNSQNAGPAALGVARCQCLWHTGQHANVLACQYLIAIEMAAISQNSDP